MFVSITITALKDTGMRKKVNRSKVRVLLDEFNRSPEVLGQYLESAACFYFPELGKLFDEGECVSFKSGEQAEKDLREFIIRAGNKLGDCDLTEVVHNFLMSRNRIPGFWRKYPKVVADKLERICKRFPKVHVKRNKEGL